MCSTACGRGRWIPTASKSSPTTVSCSRPTRAYRLEAEAATGALQLAQERAHELGAGTPERVAQRDGAAVDVHLAHVGVVLLLPREHDRRERLVDLDQVDLIDGHLRPLQRL